MKGQYEADTQIRRQPAIAPRRRRPRVLLAEDDQQMRIFLTEILLREGYHVTLCENGWELLSHLSSFIVGGQGHEDIDVVVSDIRMPGVSGLEVLEGGVENRDFPPMILITAFGDGDTHATALQYGATAILDKPFDVDDLLQELRAVAPPA
jgi:DNA-binding response OmpR family regulator